MNLTVTQTYVNWLTLLKDIVDGNINLTPSQQETLTNQAIGWPTCACGQLCQNLPKRSTISGAPQDAVLYSLGLTFAEEIGRQQYARALDTFQKIERRSAYLLRMFAW